MRLKKAKRVLALVMAALMVFGLIPVGMLLTNAKVNAAESGQALTAEAADLGNGLKGMALDTTSATVKTETNKMVIDEQSATGGVGSNGKTNAAYIYLPVTLNGLYKITADVTVNSLVERTEGQTMAGVFIGVTDDATATSPFVSIAARGDGKNNMYRQKAKGTEYGGSAGGAWTIGTKETLGLERRTGNKFYTTVDGTDMKNTSDVSSTLTAEDYTGQVFIAVSGANVTIENLKIVNGDGAVVYDQSTQEVVTGPVSLAAESQELDNGLSGMAFDTTSATVKTETNKMVIDEQSATGGVGSNGKTNAAYIYLPVTLNGLYKITADVTVNSLVERTEGQTMAGVFIGVTDDATATSPFVSIAARGDGKNNMYRQKAKGTEYGGSAGGAWTIGTKETLGLERRTGNKFYTTVDGTDMKNTSDVSSTLTAEDYTGQVFIAVSGANVTIENLKIVNGDGAVVYDQSKVEIGGGDTPVERKDWSEVAAPVIGTITQSGANVEVPFEMVIGNDGADKVTVTAKDAAGAEVASKSYAAESTSGSVSFTFSDSGTYTFSIKAIRENETDKAGTDVKFDYVLPLGKSSINLAYSKGNGTVCVEYSAVKEAASYTVEYSADGSNWSKLDAGTALTADITGLTVGTKYSFRVVAVRGAESTTSSELQATATAEAQQAWGYIVYGNGASENNASCTGSINDDGYVQLKAGTFIESNGTWSAEKNNGKWVPASFDGLGFYCTAIPATQNFTLRAKVTVNEWVLSNGQEAFGLIANDQLGGSGWNNSYSAYVSKNEYYWNGTEVTTDTTAQKVSQKLGIGAQEKIGITKDNIGKIESNDTDTINNYFKASTYPLEQRYPDAANIIGNGLNQAVTEGVDGITEMYLSIQKNNTGYFITYESVDGSYKMTKKYYDPKALEQIDSENVYVGLFLARYGNVTFSDVTLTTIDPKDDAPAEEIEIEKVAVNTSIQSPTATGSKSYEFAFAANCDGTLSIYDAKGNALAENVAVEVNKTVRPATTELVIGKNNFKFVFTPDANYVPGENKVMETYEPIEINHTVTYAVYGNEGESLWVAPDAKGNGTKANPMSIYDAVKYVQPGQTIVLMGGTYNLEKTVTVQRGIDGTADKKIYMVADPDATERPVLDFGGNCAGMVLAGDYWVFRGFDVTNSADAQKGIQVSGSYNLLDSINAYHNGNTGIQISRYLTTDLYEDWPAYNTILNCTSYGNADKGFEDADGFAAKLTVGDGNVFDGCIAHHNADDGWDLFAKVQSGAIGSVTIRNCVAYANGFLEDGTNAGNGNGFKMGGDSMPGKHVLENCVSYDNKAKGIDSNSCPDIIVKDCITFNNGSYNVAFYTNTAANTDFSADNVISFRTANLAQAEQLKLVGTQDSSKVYKDTNYFWDASSEKSLNNSGAEATADWFVSLDTSIVPTRNADGTINMNGLLELTDAAVIKTAGLSKGTASEATVIPPSISAEDIKTGDTTPIALYVILAVASMAVLAGAVVFSKKKLVK